jgi:hypothetical protein
MVVRHQTPLPLFSAPTAPQLPARTPRGALGGLYLAPAAVTGSLRNWPRAKKLAELARVKKRLAVLEARPPSTLPGPMVPLGQLTNQVEIKALRKYRRRLERAL